MGQTLFWMIEESEAVASHSERFDIPAHALFAPVVEPTLVLFRLDKVFQLHQLELTKPEDEITRSNLVAKGSPLLRDPKWHANPRGVDHVLKVNKHSLGSLRPEICLRCTVLHGADVGLKHQIEESRLTQLAPTLGAA